MEKSGLISDGFAAFDKSYQKISEFISAAGQFRYCKNVLCKTNEMAANAGTELKDQVRKNRQAFIEAVRLDIDSLRTRPI